MVITIVYWDYGKRHGGPHPDTSCVHLYLHPDYIHVRWGERGVAALLNTWCLTVFKVHLVVLVVGQGSLEAGHTAPHVWLSSCRGNVNTKTGGPQLPLPPSPGCLKDPSTTPNHRVMLCFLCSKLHSTINRLRWMGLEWKPVMS